MDKISAHRMLDRMLDRVGDVDVIGLIMVDDQQNVSATVIADENVTLTRFGVVGMRGVARPAISGADRIDASLSAEEVTHEPSP